MSYDASLADELFRAAFALPAGDVPAFLDARCSADADLRAAVERLLAARGRPDPAGEPGITRTHNPPAPDQPRDDSMEHVRTGSYEAGDEAAQPARTAANAQTLDGPTPFVHDTPGRRAEGVGAVIAGRYRLMEMIGEGGMGTVYRAEQTEPVKRQVALKLIKTGIDSRSVVARFDAERQALALMDHPNIARVYDGGTTPSGHPFFVMELVRGVALTAYCDAHRLTMKARLELFVLVCAAVQHAHQKGIIHRDLKPGNVLVTEVDGRPTPKVIDFGVAKATDQKLTDLSFTDLGVVVGTPAYMSPEQADPNATDIDTRTDVYALGVMLYELLVGSPPIDAKQFKRGAVQEILRMVREVEPPRPSTKVSTADDLPNIAANRGIDPAKLAQALRGELDWVVMKALEKDRARRYETANAFARDVQRYLADEVVEARPPSRGYRLSKFVRRHKGRVIATGLVLFALVAGTIGTAIGLVRADEQRRLAVGRLDQLIQANELTEVEKKKAERNFATARVAVFDLGERINKIETGQKNPKLADELRRQALDKAREQFDLFRTDHPDDVALQLQAALLHRYAANLSRYISDYKAAGPAYAAAVQILEDLTARFPDNPKPREDLAYTLSDRAMLEKRTGKLKDAAATIDRAAKIAADLRGTATDSAYNRTKGMIALDQSEIASKLGRFTDAARFVAEGCELLDKLKTVPVKEQRTDDPLFVAMAQSQLAVARRELGLTADALAAHNDAVARLKSMAGPNATRDVIFWDCEVRREWARTAATDPKQRDATIADLSAVIPIAEKLVDDYPHVIFYHEGLASAYLLRGEILTTQDKLDRATADLSKSLTLTRVLYDRFGPKPHSAAVLIRGKTFLAIGRAKAAAGKQDEATGDWKSAATTFAMALTIDPDNFHQQRGKKESEQALNSEMK